MNSSENKKLIYIGILIVGVALTALAFYLIKWPTIIGFVIHEQLKPEAQDPSLVLYLTFDDKNNPWKDYSKYNNVFTANNNVAWADRDVCKWYGCADFTANTKGQGSNIDFLNSSAKWSGMDGISIMFWVNHQVGSKIGGGTSQGYFYMDNDAEKWYNDNPNERKLSTGGFGMSPNFDAQKGVVGNSEGRANNPTDDVWYHYFIMYNPAEGRLYTWQNGVLTINSSEPFGQLNHSLGDAIWIGRMDNIDVQAYIDEFTVWNRSNFTSSDVLDFYNSQRQGTPPDLDLYVKAIKYEFPYDWNDDKNRLITGGTMDVVFTIANAGIKDSGSFDYEFNLDGSDICNGKISLASKTETNITCTWTTSYGFHKGFMTLDASNVISEDVKDNNAQRVYIPFLDRPFIHFDLDKWETTLKPFAQDPSNEVAYDSYDWAKSFGCADFSEGYTGNSVDPYGKKARECALGCFVNGYTEPEAPSKTQCRQATKHLFGWANRSVISYNNVQAIHELFHVGVTYDLMFPTLTKEENELLSKELHDICQQITNLENTRPDLDDDRDIIGDNGKGFGSGMGGFCYSIIGAYPENPTLIQKLDQQYWGKNIPDEWMEREISYLRAYKNDSWSKYQERWAYKFYSQFHLVENWLFEKSFGLKDVDQYQNAFCSMAREIITDVLDFNYNGNTLRNDESRTIRGVNAGDSFSYEDPGSGSLIMYAGITYYGLLCDDLPTKQAILWLRDYVHTADTASQNKYMDMYLYKQLYDQANKESKNPESIFPKVIFDNANDILTIRTNYTYSSDTVIQIDGGEEKGGGHSQAQGYYLYALGEPFLDYEQVPYEDDVRMDVWKNGISLQDTTQPKEGTGGVWNSKCGDFGYNQYYGMQTCDTPRYPDDYPDHRHFPLQYGGDLEDYVGTKDANFAGVYVWRPYKNTNPVREYFVKFGDLLAKRTVVSKNTEGKGVYHNFINIYDEFDEIRDGVNFTFVRGGGKEGNGDKFLDINLIYSSEDMTLGGGETEIAYCFSKTSCSGSSRGSGKYRRTYLHTPKDNIDFILSHYWYTEDDKKQEISYINSDDKGLQQGDNVIIFDINNDGNSYYSNKIATGWALAFNDNTKEIGAFNTDYIKDGNIELLKTDDTLSVHIKRSEDKIILTVNTMERNQYIDEPKTVRVTVDAQELANNNNFIITKNDNEVVPVISESGTKVTFEVTSGQNSDFYAITGSGQDITAPEITSLQSTQITNESALIIVKTDGNSNLTIGWGYSIATLDYVETLSTYQTVSTVSLSGLSANTAVYYQSTSCDANGNCTKKGIFNFTTLENENDNAKPEQAQNKSNKPKRDNFNRKSTNFDSVDVERVNDLTLEVESFGKILFPGETNASEMDFDANVKIKKNYIMMDSKALKKLNKSATLHLYGLDFSNPKVLRDAKPCPPGICEIISYTGGNLTFSVKHFTTYEAEETSQEESSSGGESSLGGGGGGGGGSRGSSTITSEEEIPIEKSTLGIGFVVSCTEEWGCTEWSKCFETGIQTRTCKDKNSCGTTTTKPEETRDCDYEEPAEIIKVIKDMEIPVMKDQSREVKLVVFTTLVAFLAMVSLTYLKKP